MEATSYGVTPVMPVSGGLGSDPLLTAALLSGNGGILGGNNNESAFWSDKAEQGRNDGIRDQLQGLDSRINDQNSQSNFANLTAQVQQVQANLAECCCDNRVATEQVKSTICEQARQTDNVIHQQTISINDRIAGLGADLMAGRISSQEQIIQNQSTQSILSAINGLAQGVSALAVASSGGNGNGNNGNGNGRGVGGGG